jgi:SAM-dependent methyltransferase
MSTTIDTPAVGSSAVGTRLAEYTAARDEQREDALSRLVAAVWHDGSPTGQAAAAVPELVAALPTLDAEHVGGVAFLLGLLAETDPDGDGELFTSVRQGLPAYLALVAEHRDDEPVLLALLYLLAHFPADADAVLAAVAEVPLAEEDRSRLQRCLAAFDPTDLVLGRVWPSPVEWALTDAERDFDREWTSALPVEQAAVTWAGDTRMVLGYAGARAYWAQRSGTPVRVEDTSPHRDFEPVTGPSDAHAGVVRHVSVLRCPDCHGELDVEQRGTRCTDCARRVPLAHGVLDFTADPVSAEAVDGEDPDDVLSNAAAMNSIGMYYETVLRPGFLRLMGTNWGGQVSPTDEDAYLAEHLRTVEGPVLDLAAGAGRWTAVLADLLGAERLIALDLNPTMLSWLRGRLPDVCAVQASALDLPFGTGTLGAVNCWNALQATPDPAAAIAEVGRCLKVGGTFTLLTFRRSDDPVLRYFQSTFRGPGFPDGGMPLFSWEEIHDWLTAAGLAVRDESGPGSFVFVTAQRVP